MAVPSARLICLAGTGCFRGTSEGGARGSMGRQCTDMVTAMSIQSASATLTQLDLTGLAISAHTLWWLLRGGDTPGSLSIRDRQTDSASSSSRLSSGSPSASSSGLSSGSPSASSFASSAASALRQVASGSGALDQLQQLRLEGCRGVPRSWRRAARECPRRLVDACVRATGPGSVEKELMGAQVQTGAQGQSELGRRGASPRVPARAGQKRSAERSQHRASAGGSGSSAGAARCSGQPGADGAARPKKKPRLDGDQTNEL